jgi:hypothetical protein
MSISLWGASDEPIYCSVDFYNVMVFAVCGALAHFGNRQNTDWTDNLPISRFFDAAPCAEAKKA